MVRISAIQGQDIASGAARTWTEPPRTLSAAVPCLHECGKAATRLRMCADARRGVAVHALGEMVSRVVEDAGRRLHELRLEELGDGAVAATALGLAVAASAVRPAFALPLFIGGVFVGARAVLAAWRRWDLIDRLVVERDA